MSRRTFLAGAWAAGAAALMGGPAFRPETALAAPSARAASPAPSPTQAPFEADAVHETDLLIVGAGGSGLACAVQAALNGLDVVLVEKGDEVGGNARHVKGMFAVNSPLQREQGMDILPASVVEAELARGRHRASGDLWLDFVNASAENLLWCVEQGAVFSGAVDDRRRGAFPTLHRFGDGAASTCYVEPMRVRLDELGVPVHRRTAVNGLIMDGRAVVGAYAEGEAGILRYDAKAVVLATGGFGGNPALVREQGWRAGDVRAAGSPLASGDGCRLARSVGAIGGPAESASAILYAVEALSGGDARDDAEGALAGPHGLASGGSVLWVNEACRRFAREDVACDDVLSSCLPGKGNKGNYAVFDQGILDRLVAGDEGARRAIDASLGAPENESLRRGDSLEEACGAFGLDPNALAAAVTRYNELCRSGEDADFGKAAAFLVPLETPPFYLAKLSYRCFFTVGGIAVDRRCRVLDGEREPIEGLYAIGNDGSMLHRGVYAPAAPGSAFGYQIHSGREAANAVAEALRG